MGKLLFRKPVNSLRIGKSRIDIEYSQHRTCFPDARYS